MSQGYNEPSRSAVRESGGGSDIPVAVVRAAQAGDADALEAVVRGLYPLVSRWALVKIGSAQDAEDVTQETMIRVSKYINRFESRGKITTWAYQITSNAVADHYRRARLRALALHPALLGALAQRRARRLLPLPDR